MIERWVIKEVFLAAQLSMSWRRRRKWRCSSKHFLPRTSCTPCLLFGPSESLDKICVLDGNRSQVVQPVATHCPGRAALRVLLFWQLLMPLLATRVSSGVPLSVLWSVLLSVLWSVPLSQLWSLQTTCAYCCARDNNFRNNRSNPVGNMILRCAYTLLFLPKPFQRILNIAGF